MTILGMSVIARFQKIHETAGTLETPTSTRTLLATLSTAATVQKQKKMLLVSERCLVMKCQQQQGGQPHISILAIYEKC
jgi:hypothetical protein